MASGQMDYGQVHYNISNNNKPSTNGFSTVVLFISGWDGLDLRAGVGIEHLTNTNINTNGLCAGPIINIVCSIPILKT